jgi:Cd2+/Zn2+-exporting ATPase
MSEMTTGASAKTNGRTYSKVLVLNGLCCANCAAKIENAAGRLPGVTGARLSFATSKLTIEAESSRALEAAAKQAAKIAVEIEDGIRVTEENAEEEEESFGRAAVLRLIAGAVLFFTAVLFRLDTRLEAVLYGAACLLAGGDVLLKAVKNIARGHVFDENFLMGLAAVVAFAIGQYPEGAAVMLFYQVGELLQASAVGKSRKAIAALMDIRPDFADVRRGDAIVRLSPAEVQVGELIIVRPGERVPLDGIVAEGVSMLDTSALTGESVPREIEPGNEVLSGAINKSGLLTIRVTKPFGESTVVKILELVENAASKKAKTENFISKFARYYTPAVVIAAVLIAFLPPLFVSGASLSQWINRALVFLVASCPCALVISIPLGYFGGIGGASSNGILIKGGSYLEALNRVETVVLDKTGTLTKGVFKVTGVSPAAGVTDSELLEYAAYAESFSNHPIAASVTAAYGRDIDKNAVSAAGELPGFGVRATVRGRTVAAGNERLMAREGIAPEALKTSGETGTFVHVAVDGSYAGYIVISDEVKADSAPALRKLRAAGIRLVMLTGDNRETAEKIGRDLGLDEVRAGLLPDGKVAAVEELEAQLKPGGKLVFVGDGINDAPVLARADIGVAMGGVGSDAAIEAADVVLMTDEPSKLVTAIKIARKTHAVVLQNIIFALAVKAVVLVLGAGGLANIWEAVFADVGVALIAVLNAVRTMRVKGD